LAVIYGFTFFCRELVTINSSQKNESRWKEFNWNYLAYDFLYWFFGIGRGPLLQTMTLQTTVPDVCKHFVKHVCCNGVPVDLIF
jgi:hypothetical protein